MYTACAHFRWACSFPHLSPCLACFCGNCEELLTAIQGGVVESCNVDEKRGLRCTSLREWVAGFWFFGTPVTTRELVHVQVGQCYFQRTNPPRTVARGAHFQSTSGSQPADDVRVTSHMVKSEPWTMRWMRWHKTQRSKNTPSSLQVNVPDRVWLPLMERRCFLARQDRWRGTLVLTSTLWAAFDLNSNEGARRPSELGPDFARCGFVQASHYVFGAFFFFQAPAVSIL